MPVPKYQEEFYMKKLISILVVFALLAGAVFAQEGSWSIGGSGEVGARIDFTPMQDFQSGTLQWGHAEIGASKWDGGKDDLRGNLDVTYKAGGLETGFGINQHGGMTLKLTNYGENWTFGAEQNLAKLFSIFNGSELEANSDARGKLFGNYTFQVLNGIKLEVAIENWTGGQWNTTDIFGDTFTHSNNLGPGIGNYGANYILIDASPMDGLNLGIQIPQFFSWWNNVDFVTAALQYTRFGAKFATGPVGVALQFALEGQGQKFAKDGDYGKKDITVNDADLNSALYLGVQYQISDQMKAGLEFRGFFGGQKFTYNTGNYTNADYDKYTIADAVGIKIGASFNYDDGPFGAGITIKFEDDDTNTSADYKSNLDHNSTFTIAPSVYYNIVPEYLKAQLDFNLTFTERPTLQQSADLKDYDDRVFESRVGYSFTPQLYFNFLGTGAGGWDTGMALKWGVGGTFDEPVPPGQPDNYLQLSFKWSF